MTSTIWKKIQSGESPRFWSHQNMCKIYRKISTISSILNKIRTMTYSKIRALLTRKKKWINVMLIVAKQRYEVQSILFFQTEPKITPGRIENHYWKKDLLQLTKLNVANLIIKEIYAKKPTQKSPLKLHAQDFNKVYFKELNMLLSQQLGVVFLGQVI